MVFYGLGRSQNKVRWIQQTWWRYLQARWGYSPNIHSWELTNEGIRLEKALRTCRRIWQIHALPVFGIEPGLGDSAPAPTIILTLILSPPPSGIHSQPRNFGLIHATQRRLCDLHAYISTSPAPAADKQRSSDRGPCTTSGTAGYGKFGHRQPVVRGEAA